MILTPIYEVEFLGFSYGFRPGRGAHDALDALAFGIERRKVSWIVDADIRAYFDTIPRDWLITFLEHRIFADLNRRQRGVGKPETFDFLGLTHYCTTTLRGRFRLGRKPVAKRVNRQGKLVHSLGLSWLDRGAAFPRMIGSPVGRFADGGMSGPRWGSGYGLTITCRHIGALRLRSGAGPSAWRFALPVEGGRALRVSGWVVAVYWRSF